MYYIKAAVWSFEKKVDLAVSYIARLQQRKAICTSTPSLTNHPHDDETYEHQRIGPELAKQFTHNPRGLCISQSFIYSLMLLLAFCHVPVP